MLLILLIYLEKLNKVNNASIIFTSFIYIKIIFIFYCIYYNTNIGI